MRKPVLYVVGAGIVAVLVSLAVHAVAPEKGGPREDCAPSFRTPCASAAN